MNLVVVPFHDWRKSEKEGFRTRDVHFIKSLSENSNVQKLLVINRPSTWLEFLYKRQKKKLKGKVILKRGKFSLTQVAPEIFVTDYFSNDVFNQLLKKHLWFIEKYNSKGYLSFIDDSCAKLDMDTKYLITQNIFSYKLAVKIDAKEKLFDAWDNFLKFPAYKGVKNELENGYELLARNISFWTTNSKENIKFFKDKFNVNYIGLVKNGVKTNFISGSSKLEIPDDLRSIKKPIIGFGGKISYLLNYELINYITKENPESSFVFVGQVLDKNVYEKIIKRKNVFFLGDKHYSVYPKYVQNFDICIVPYNIREGQHGGDSIKAYEYLLTQKKVVGTKGNGLQDLNEYIYLVDDANEFSAELKDLKNEKPFINIEEHSWERKGNRLLEILKGYVNE
ncbi:glycosyltransferase family protein [Aquimarina algiphila]|uniref:hypothetical protein n=1 Tax=Aquimarina algiphila TaxID=2047982 RepID=UPI00232AF062|nr:hypothetical protein [Aquimarina algiphila]